MEEEIVAIRPSKIKNKKYTATVKNPRTGKTRVVHFGASDYGQYKDLTESGAYSSKDHLDKKRRASYFKRMSGTTKKREAIRLELKKSKGLVTPKILSHLYLW